MYNDWLYNSDMKTIMKSKYYAYIRTNGLELRIVGDGYSTKQEALDFGRKHGAYHALKGSNILHSIDPNRRINLHDPLFTLVRIEA